MTKEELKEAFVNEMESVNPEEVLNGLSKMRGIHPELDELINHAQTWVTADLRKEEIETVVRYWPHDLQELWATTEKIPEGIKVKAFFWVINATAQAAVLASQNQKIS